MYLDPGFGSMLIQFLLAGIAVLGAVWFSMKNKIKAHFAKKKGAVIEEASDEDDDIPMPVAPQTTEIKQGDTTDEVGDKAVEK